MSSTPWKKPWQRPAADVHDGVILAQCHDHGLQANVSQRLPSESRFDASLAGLCCACAHQLAISGSVHPSQAGARLLHAVSATAYKLRTAQMLMTATGERRCTDKPGVCTSVGQRTFMPQKGLCFW